MYLVEYMDSGWHYETSFKEIEDAREFISWRKSIGDRYQYRIVVEMAIK